jgi:hypothetical protein
MHSANLPVSGIVVIREKAIRVALNLRIYNFKASSDDFVETVSFNVYLNVIVQYIIM